MTKAGSLKSTDHIGQQGWRAASRTAAGFPAPARSGSRSGLGSQRRQERLVRVVGRALQSERSPTCGPLPWVHHGSCSMATGARASAATFTLARWFSTVMGSRAGDRAFAQSHHRPHGTASVHQVAAGDGEGRAVACRSGDAGVPQVGIGTLGRDESTSWHRASRGSGLVRPETGVGCGVLTTSPLRQALRSLVALVARPVPISNSSPVPPIRPRHQRHRQGNEATRERLSTPAGSSQSGDTGAHGLRWRRGRPSSSTPTGLTFLSRD